MYVKLNLKMYVKLNLKTQFTTQFTICTIL
jgi:hypothetical protein